MGAHVSIETSQGKAEAMLDYNLLESDKQFNSGIPFFFTSTPTEAVILNNMVKLNSKTYYIPHNTITQTCAIYKDFSDPSGKRKTWISDKFRAVAESLLETIKYQTQLSWIKSSDAETLAAKQASIAKVKKQIATLVARLAVLQALKITLSGQLQTTQTTISETLITKTKKTTYKLSLEVTIKQ